jgi:mono/diheme cytochrome c family protein
MGGTAGMSTGGAGGFVPAVDRMTAWNDENYGCVNCHGDEGEGIANRGPEIKHPNRELFDFMVRQGDAMPLVAYRDPMDAVGPELVSDAILDDIFEWLWSFPKPTTGAELYADFCSYCHGADGRGGTTMQTYASAYHSAPFIRKQGSDFLTYLRMGHLMDDMGNPVEVMDRNAWMPPVTTMELTDQEIALIQAWLPQN